MFGGWHGPGGSRRPEVLYLEVVYKAPLKLAQVLGVPALVSRLVLVSYLAINQLTGRYRGNPEAATESVCFWRSL